MALTHFSCSVWLDELTFAVQQHEQAPPLNHNFHFVSPLGRPYYLCIKRKDPVDSTPPASNASSSSLVSLLAACTSDDYYLGVFLYWGGEKPAAAPSEAMRYSVAVNAVNGPQHVCLAENVSVEVPADTWSAQSGFGSARLLKWSELRRAVVDDGFRLQATVFVSSSKHKADLSTSLHIPPPPGSMSSSNMLFSGPFSDALVRAGEREFKVHRVVLAAASPVFLSMLSGEMQEGRSAVVEIRESEAAVVELLLQHMYGAEVDVPLPLAAQLYGLADQYHLQSSLGQQLRLWLSTLLVKPAALGQLLPAVYTLCPAAFESSLREQAEAAGSKVQWQLPAPPAAVEATRAPSEGGESAADISTAAGEHVEVKPRCRWYHLFGIGVIDWGKGGGRDHGDDDGVQARRLPSRGGGNLPKTPWRGSNSGIAVGV